MGGKDEPALTEKFLINNVETANKSFIADKFNEFFTEIGPKLANSISNSKTSFRQYLNKSPSTSMKIELTSHSEIVSIANELSNTKSSGLDLIDPQITKIAITAISDPLANIINCSIESGLVPNRLKLAKIIPVYKTGEKSLINNYRPISILPYFSKYFEKVMHNRLLTYLTKGNVLFEGQYGFRHGRATSMAVLEMHDKIMNAIDNNEYAMGVSLDRSI